ncbi:MAG: 4Fe-4S dicluster domain-containing protein [Phycisphaerae bacterium]|jgi:glycolate oxidase iron-sulfur subunit
MYDVKLEPRISERFFDCVHCGLCLGQCPTYAQTGDENDSPRGRIYLMRRLHEGHIQPGDRVLRHLSLCLDCRACETACPSGVRYGSLIEAMRGRFAVAGLGKPARNWADRLLDRFMYDVFPYPRKLNRWLWLARLGQAIGFNEFLRASGLIHLLPGPLAKMEAMLPPDLVRCEPLPAHARPPGKVRARVALFRGCVSESIFGPTNRATWRVLLANDCEVFVPDSQGCCGAIHHHGGRHREAQEMAKANIAAFEALGPDVDAYVTNVAGCGTMLKEYEELLHDDTAWAERARRFVGKMKDINEFLAALPLKPPTRPLPMKVTYHEACHLCHGQQIRAQPRALLKAIPGLELIELPESDWCCGAAGTYNLTEPEMSAKLAERKLANVDSTGAEVVATANAGCLMQLLQHVRASGRRVRVVHPIDLLDAAYAASPAAMSTS